MRDVADRGLYHLFVNSTLGLDTCAGLIMNAIRFSEMSRGPGERRDSDLAGLAGALRSRVRGKGCFAPAAGAQLSFVAGVVFGARTLLAKAFDQQDGFGDIADGAPQAAALVAQTLVGFFFAQAESLLQDALGALDDFALFQLLADEQGFFVELDVVSARAE